MTRRFHHPYHWSLILIGTILLLGPVLSTPYIGNWNMPRPTEVAINLLRYVGPLLGSILLTFSLASLFGGWGVLVSFLLTLASAILYTYAFVMFVTFSTGMEGIAVLFQYGFYALSLLGLVGGADWAFEKR